MRAASSPARHLGALLAFAALVLVALLAHTGALEAGPARGALSWASPEASGADPLARRIARADTDSVAVGADSLLVGDSLAADTTEADSTARARYLLPALPRENFYAVPIERLVPALLGGRVRARQQQVLLDSSALRYSARELVGNTDIRTPIELSLDEYLAAQREANVADGFRQLTDTRLQRQQRRAGVGFNIDIPGGNQSAFTTIFGKNEVDLRVTGNSTLDLGAGYDQNALSQARTGNDGSFAPDFGQELNLNVAGTIGDKLRINVNYDTQSQFDFENQVSLVYTGYEDDIIQKIEAGNVFLQTPSELIRGGQRLFGLRTDLQFGPLSVTGVASQQDAESEEVVIEGGSQATPIDLAPYRYEDNTHFFLGFAFYNWWDRAHQDPSNPTTPPGLTRITGLEVWVQDAQANNPTTSNDENIFGTALVDLGEPEDVLQGGRAYLDARGPEAPLPSPIQHKYSEADLVRLRTQNDEISYTEEFGLTENDYQSGRWRKLTSGTDYKFDENLGWLSLTGSLGPDDAIAVSYQYRTPTGQTITIGDFASPSQTSENRTILKLLRDDAPVPEAAAWDLTMRNIYRIGGRSLNADDFELSVTYEQPGSTPQETLPGITIGDGFSLLQAFGLDRTGASGVPRPDNEFDFALGYTVDAQSGRIIFPVREPFGRYIEGLLRDGTYVSGETLGITIPGGYESVAADVAFPRLYEVKPEVASREINKLNRYRLSGEYRSASQSVFNVGFGVVEGSVTVTSGGVTLIEGQDYVVNETQGTVEIQNPIYLAPGQQVRVQVERNQLFSIGSKTLIGLRSDYRISENAGLGATWMRLAERPLTDKFRIGEEALRNTVFGFDGGFTYEPRWVTRLLDGLPLIQTRAPSSFEIRGEYAQFSPGHPETFAFREVQRTLDAIDRSLADDELNGISSIDDFEGAENVNSALEQAPGWRIAAPPRFAGPMNGAGTVAYERGVTPINDPRLATSWRGLFGWYAIAGQAYERLDEIVGGLPRAAQPVLPGDLYPGREFSPTERSQPLTLLDLYFDPSRRGPYNYNRELGTTFVGDPASVWGGMIRSLDAAYADFDGANTVESIEFLMAPLGGRDGEQPINPGAVLHIDLGSLNEETIPNGTLNSEDGLTDTPETSVVDEWSRRITNGVPNSNVDVFEASGRTEDLGLDGLPSRRDLVASGGTPYPLAEGDLDGVSEFLGALPQGAELQRALDDPAGDNYHHFRDTYFDNNGLFPGGASAQERYAHYYAGSELNNDIARRAILPGEENGISQVPSSEDINDNFGSTRQDEEQFFRYTLPLDEAGLRASPYFTGSTIEASGATFYLVRIPVRNPTVNEGGNLSNVEMVRVWTEGHLRPATLRFATFELVGSQWQKSEQVGILDADGGIGSTELFIASINTDENPQQYLPPVSALRPVSRDFSGATRDAREQSLVMRIEDLGEGEFRGLYKPYTTNRLDLTKYSNVRMYVHGEGFEHRDSVRVFMRLGSDETENYYEIEQPLYPSESDGLIDVFGNGTAFDFPTQAADYLWQTRACPGGDDPEGDGPATRASCAEAERQDLNSINVVLSELNKLKVARDASGASITERYTEDRRPEGAPPGARITVIGTPSIQSVSSVVVGIRNGESGDAVPLDDVEVWFNELRVTGYDEGGGSSAFVSAQARLADVVTANARVSLSQDGFGGLTGGLGERDFVDRLGFTVSSTFNAHKLLPERYGWSAPVQVSITENQSTPRFDPTNSDIRIDDLAEQVLTDETIPEARRPIIADSIRQAAQTVTSQRTLRVPLSKTGSRSPWLKYTLDALALSYTNSTSEGRSPRQLLNGSDSWSVDASYRLTVPRPRTVRPFWWTSGVPLLGSALGDVRMNLLPRSLSFSANTGRSITESRERPRSSDLGQPEIVNEFLYPRRVTHDFGHRRSFNLQYELFPFLTTSYGSNSTQSLDLAGVNERFRLLARDTSGVFGEPGRIEEFSISREDALLPGSEVWDRFGITSQEEFDQLQILGGTTAQLDVIPWNEALGATLGGYRRLLTDRYDQQFSTSLRISTRNVKWLAWIQPQPISVASTYAWNFQPVTGFEDQTVAGVGSSVQVQSGLRFKPRDFWRLFPFYRGLEEDDRAARQRSDQRRRERDAERQRRRDERERERELEEIGEVDITAEVPDETEAPEAVGETPEAADAPEASGGPSPVATFFGGLGRRVFLGVTGIEDLQVTYRGAFTSTANGIVGDGFSLLAAATGNAPPLGYRIGLDRRLPLASRLSAPGATLQLQDVLGADHQLEGRTTFQPTQDLRISLTATTSWDENDTFPIERTADALIEQDPIRRGSNQSTVFGIGSTYAGFVDRHLQRLADDASGGADGSGFIPSAAGSASGLAEDFNETFAGGAGRFGPDGLFTLPLPSWDVNWTGLSRWPIFNRFTQQVTVQHAYFASNQAEYASLDALGDRTRTIGSFDLIAPLTDVEPTALVINERFQPFVGVRIGWKGGLQTEITHNRSRVLTLQPASAQLTQKNVSDIQGNISYSKAGFRLPFMSRLRNTIRFTLTASVTDDQTRVRSVVSDIENVLAGGEIAEPQGQEFKRVSIWPRVGYQISNRVNMDVFFRYERSLTAGTTGSPSIATYDGGVTLRISFSN